MRIKRRNVRRSSWSSFAVEWMSAPLYVPSGQSKVATDVAIARAWIEIAAGFARAGGARPPAPEGQGHPGIPALWQTPLFAVVPICPKNV